MNAPPQPLRLGTRNSPLAMAQAHMVKAGLLTAHGWGDADIVIVPVVASGDKVLDRALAEVGGKALWTKELDAWLIGGEIDFAVHSMKDVETIRPAEIAIAAMLERADVRDRLIGVASLDDLPHGAKLGTSAPRRAAQLLRMRPDLKITLFRGNVQTRLRKLGEGEVVATLLAAAGLDRLGMGEIGVSIPVEVMLPAPSQGAIGIEARAGDDAVRGWLAAIDHRDTHLCVKAERTLLAALCADCRSPVAALGIIEDDQIWLRAEIYAADGAEMVSGEAQFDSDYAAAASVLAADLLARASPSLRASFG